MAWMSLKFQTILKAVTQEWQYHDDENINNLELNTNMYGLWLCVMEELCWKLLFNLLMLQSDGSTYYDTSFLYH